MRPFPTPLRLMVGLALGILLGVGGFALSQVTQITGPLGGLEAVVVAGTGPGGQSYFTTTGRLSNGRSYAYFTAFPTASFTIGQATPPTGTTVNVANVATGGALLFNVTNGTAITITLPATGQLIDGEIIEICNVTASAWLTNAVTVAANANQSFVGTNIQTLTTLAASSCAKWFWNSTAATWFNASGAAAGAM